MVRLTFDLVSTFTSAVTFLFLKEVFTSPVNPSPLFTPVEVKAFKDKNILIVNKGLRKAILNVTKSLSTMSTGGPNSTINLHLYC
jgi:hypothetical protein